jgi:hypothetical protein
LAPDPQSIKQNVGDGFRGCRILSRDQIAIGDGIGLPLFFPGIVAAVIPQHIFDQ